MLVPQLLPTRPHAAPAPHRKPPARGPDADGDGDDSAALDLALLARQQGFDLTVKLRAENEREMNILRDLAMAQVKKDDENMKKWIALI